MNAIAPSSNNVGLSDAEFAAIASFANDAAGLSIPASKKSLVQARISRRLRQLKLGSCAEYLALLERETSEATELISVLTTNVSSFYRESRPGRRPYPGI